MGLAQSLAPVIDFVFPPRCPLCGEGLAAQTGMCPTCWNDLVIPADPSCALCQRPFTDAMNDSAICAPCMAQPPHHDGIAAATLYNEASRKLVLALKHGRRIALAPMMARLMSGRLRDVDAAWIAIPVPLHRWRLWRRGFNQAAVLAGEIAQQRGLQLAVDTLVRRKPTPVLGALGAKARRRALSGAIAVAARHRASLRGAKVLLVDDVLTSGATSNACISALKRAGAVQVVVCCFSRVLEDALG